MGKPFLGSWIGLVSAPWCVQVRFVQRRLLILPGLPTRPNSFPTVPNIQRRWVSIAWKFEKRECVFFLGTKFIWPDVFSWILCVGEFENERHLPARCGPNQRNQILERQSIHNLFGVLQSLPLTHSVIIHTSIVGITIEAQM